RTWKVEGRHTKVLLRKIASRWLPAETVARSKQGFGPPIATWLRTSMRRDVDELCEADAAINGLVEPAAVRRVVTGHRAGEWRDGQVWTLLVLDRWARAARAVAKS